MLENTDIPRLFQLFIGVLFFGAVLLLTRDAEIWQQLVAASLVTLVWSHLGARS